MCSNLLLSSGRVEVCLRLVRKSRAGWLGSRKGVRVPPRGPKSRVRLKGESVHIRGGTSLSQLRSAAARGRFYALRARVGYCRERLAERRRHLGVPLHRAVRWQRRVRRAAEHLERARCDRWLEARGLRGRLRSRVASRRRPSGGHPRRRRPLPVHEQHADDRLQRFCAGGRDLHDRPRRTRVASGSRPQRAP